jgi:beta-glucanase (GH16 family)
VVIRILGGRGRRGRDARPSIAVALLALAALITACGHIYAVEWDPTQIRWYVDSTLYQTVTPKDLPGAWVFDHPFFILLNLAVGGDWPGAPDSTTVFPQAMLVDYVRVYQQSAAP